MWFNLSQFIIFKDGLPFGILMTQKVDSFQNHLDLASSMKKRLHSSQKMLTLQIIFYCMLFRCIKYASILLLETAYINNFEVDATTSLIFLLFHHQTFPIKLA